MKKKLLIAALVLALILMLAGCGCEHEWVEANCVDPQTCSLCQQTEGAPLGHSWLAANCSDPKTCENCGTTEGEAKGHTWVDATCTVPEKCSVCHETKGDPLEHSWEEATTEAPKTCTNCGKTEGTKIQTDPRFTTATTKHLHGKWTSECVLDGEMLGLQDYFDEVPCTLYYVFGNDGTVAGIVELHDQLAFMDSLKEAIKDTTYKELEANGISKSDTDAAIKAQFGMTMDEYVDALVEVMDIESLLEQMSVELVYYATENNFYMAADWNDDFEPNKYRMEDGKLYTEEPDILGEDQYLEWTKVEA